MKSVLDRFESSPTVLLPYLDHILVHDLALVEEVRLLRQLLLQPQRPDDGADRLQQGEYWEMSSSYTAREAPVGTRHTS